MLQESWVLPVLKTPRLILRPFILEDGPEA